MCLKEITYLRCFFTSSLLILVFVCSYGQSKFQVGFRTGINFSSLTGIEPELNESFAPLGSSPIEADFFSYQYDVNYFNDAATRFSIYTDVSYKLTNNLKAQLGIGYAGRGMNLQEEGAFYKSEIAGNTETILFGNYLYSMRIKTNYLSFPVNMRYYVGLRHRFFITAGAYFDFLLSSKVYGDQSYITQRDVITDGASQTVMLAFGDSHLDDLNAHTSKFDFGLTYGGGIEFPINQRLNFVFAVSMNHGLIKIDGKYDNDTQVFIGTSSYIVVHNNYYGLNSNSKNLTLSANVGILYLL